MSIKPVSFDPRTKLVLLIYANVIMFLHVPLLPLMVSILFFTSLYVVSGKGLKGLIYLAIFLIASFVEFVLVDVITVPVLPTILSVLSVAVRRFLPCVMAGYFAFSTTKASEWIVTLKTLLVPHNVIIPVTVMLRFFPSVMKDYQNIRKAMAFRGIATSIWGLFSKPIQAIEHIFVPLLMNATTTADDLAAASLTRGISYPGQHTSYTTISVKAHDWLVISTTFLLLCYHIMGWMP
ncbi:energy-coupling factor transporter transmembrane protein EcfT [Salipaludibacillus sp. LMS25]|jgi:energy-coupling factor transport system permease protein|uniref:energy-coupling factor transporter transmembrane component T n=1 Tax=Salipaludibacillus sp. LMS25 TaxID=2924031 RepID=UPI0020D0338F|nr:energy-coupling factor transporter transmembrane component T [Salipaludibacillus sp. LMS25]UTR13752.1 energy-coupling factor transporter transmembrane protein EcfT [Salipaludibacillus sp. LMS25]